MTLSNPPRSAHLPMLARPHSNRRALRPLLAFVGLASVACALLAPAANANLVRTPSASTPPSSSAPLTCTPPAGGATCDPAKGPATLGGVGNGGLDLGAGNPINLVTGNKYQRETDMAALPGVLGLEIVRHYNSAYSREHSRSGILGRGWKLSYETRLHISARNIQVLQADGSRIIFERDAADPDRCASHDPAHGMLHIEQTAAGTRYLWQWPGGERLHFDDGGRLTQIRAPSGEFLSLRYRSDGALLQVTDPQGRSLHLSYPTASEAGEFRGVRHIDSPRGRFSYVHGTSTKTGADAARLAAVRFPVAASAAGDRRVPIERRYHYEDERHPALLTGISVSGSGSDGVMMNVRINSWAYDENGRAIRSVRGAPTDDYEEVRLRYLRAATTATDGITEIRNSFGQLTRYRHRIIGGEYRIVEARGPGCASCAPGDRRYHYDDAGRLLEVAVLAAADPDKDARTLAATRYRRDTHGRVIVIEEITIDSANKETVRDVQRLAYEDARWPGRATRIARPSVVSGVEHVIHLSFNDAGQLTEVLERGFSPLTVDAEAPATAVGPQAIERKLRYHFADINGRSVLVAVDGPLPNGDSASPQDSDITELHWDARGDFVQAVTRPGGRRSEFTRDARSGITIAVRDDDGQRADFELDEHGEILTVRTGQEASSAIVHSRLRDALGRETGFGFGSPTAGDYRALARLAYDAAGRLQWAADARGFLSELIRDREGRVVESVRSSASMQQRARSPEMRPATDGSETDRPFWPRQRIDDFGRIVATHSPDSGETRRGFDAADRLVWMRDALGNLARYDYTADGRIARQGITAAHDGAETLTHWRYAGPHLLRVEHPNQDQAFEYDARALRVARIVTLRTHDGEHRFRTRYEHDTRGRLVAHTLADGSRVNYLRNGQGQVVAIERNPVRNRWLRRLVRPQRIVAELERDLVGLRRYLTGNGIEALHQRSTEGVLARIAYRDLNASAARSILRAAVREARAQPVAVQAAPGAFGLPIDHTALLDFRYLWDEGGKLRFQRSRATHAVLDSHAYDGSARLIASLRAPEADSDASAQAAASEIAQPESWRYAYDLHGRRVLAQQGSDPAELSADTEHHSFAPGSHRFADRPYDSSGQPLADGTRRYEWDAFGRLAAVHADGRLLARYRYDHRGLRDAKETSAGHEYFLHDADRQLAAHIDAAGRITRQYLYLGDAPLLLIDSPHGKTAPAPGSFAALIDDFATVLASWTGTSRERLYWVHSNHLGAPEAVTDENAQVVWRARYTPFGEVRTQDRIESGLRLDLRLPGQIFDAETGLHYNRARYYDPQAGQYLSPDPLGTPDGPNSYAYVAFNPLQFIDPDGLALFAFDGTTNHDRDQKLVTNVYRFREAYRDGRAYYISGVGTTHYDEVYGDIRYSFLPGGHTMDSINNFTGPDRIERMMIYFTNEAANTPSDQIMDVDIVGFSRGAAQAREFANRVAAATINGVYYYSSFDLAGMEIQSCQRVNLRFIGLFDTVLSTNNSGLSYNLDIPDAFSHVAHAIALNEFRGGAVLGRPPGAAGGFDLESIHMNASGSVLQSGQTRIEMGFIGAHSDIGGGYEDGDLSDVALSWMVKQAIDADVTMTKPPLSLPIDPVIHDRSNAIKTGKPTDRSEDRIVRYRDGSTTTQRNMVLNSGMSFPDTQEWINYQERSPKHDIDYAGNSFTDANDPEERRIADVTGTVNAAGYLDWLKKHGYEF